MPLLSRFRSLAQWVLIPLSRQFARRRQSISHAGAHHAAGPSRSRARCMRRRLCLSHHLPRPRRGRRRGGSDPRACRPADTRGLVRVPRLLAQSAQQAQWKTRPLSGPVTAVALSVTDEKHLQSVRPFASPAPLGEEAQCGYHTRLVGSPSTTSL
jgi:hypothetical protein